MTLGLADDERVRGALAGDPFDAGGREEEEEEAVDATE